MTTRKRKGNLEYTVGAIVYLIKERPQLEILKDAGDITATQIIMDLDTILKEADPTDKQLEAMELIWVQGYKLKEAGEMLGVTAQGVHFNLKLLKRKIKAVTERWSKDGRYIV